MGHTPPTPTPKTQIEKSKSQVSLAEFRLLHRQSRPCSLLRRSSLPDKTEKKYLIRALVCLKIMNKREIVISKRSSVNRLILKMKLMKIYWLVQIPRLLNSEEKNQKSKIFNMQILIRTISSINIIIQGGSCEDENARSNGRR